MKKIFTLSFLFLLCYSRLWCQEIYSYTKKNDAEELAYDLKICKAKLQIPKGFILLVSDSLKNTKCNDYYTNAEPTYNNNPDFYLINGKQGIIIGFDIGDWRINSASSKLLPAKSRTDFFMEQFSSYLHDQDMKTLFLYDSTHIANKPIPDNSPKFAGEYQTKCDHKLNDKYERHKVIFGWLANGLFVRYFYFYDPKINNTKRLNKLINNTFSIIN